MDDVGRIATLIQNRVTNRPPDCATITQVKDAKRHQIRLHLIGRWRYPLIVPMNELGSGDFFLFEYPMLKWIERVSYDVTYISDLDTDRTIDVLLGHLGDLSVGHDEYWSWEKRDHVDGRATRGVSLGFFGANPHVLASPI